MNFTDFKASKVVYILHLLNSHSGGYIGIRASVTATEKHESELTA